MNRSPLHDLHSSLGARFVDFGGWEMPLQYESVLGEHRIVRSAAGLFDVTHLGRFQLSGPGARRALRRLLCNDIDRIGPGRCQYTMMLNERGGILDDMIIWWWDDTDFWVMPNAVNQDRVMTVFQDQEGCAVTDLQTTTALIAVQGPGAPGILEHVLGVAPRRFRTVAIDWEGRTLRAAGTGYTGEPGGEIGCDPATAHQLVEALLAAGTRPCGLGSRDTLRLEAGLPLWGNDIDETTTPLEAGLGFAVDLGHDFVGRDPLVEQDRGGVDRRLTGFVLEERGVPRAGYRIRAHGGAEGEVTSGNMSPMLERGIGLAYLSPPAGENERVEVEIRGRWVGGRVALPPFHESPGVEGE